MRLNIIFIKDGKLETANYAKDIPIFLSRKSCHPGFVFRSVVKSVGFRLNQNCSEDDALWKRKNEYSRYLYASYFKPKEVKEIGLSKNEEGYFVHGEARKKREDRIFRPRKNRNLSGNKKFVLVSNWDPRNPDIATVLRENKDTLYRDPVNRRLFPEGSVMSGFRRRRNLGEIICPTNPRRQPRPPNVPVGGGGCEPCGARRCQIHQNLVTANRVISPWDNRPKKIYKHLNCSTPNLVYYLKCGQCPCPGIPHYTGSTVDFKARWRSHKSDMTRLAGRCCNFCEHWSRHHSGAPNDLGGVQIFFLDSVEDPGPKAEGYPKLRQLESKWMVDLGSLGSLDPLQGCNRKDDAAARAWGT